MYGSLTTKELKKHSSRPVGGVETGSWGGQDVRQGGAVCVDKLGGTTGERDRLPNPGFQHREMKPQNI